MSRRALLFFVLILGFGIGSGCQGLEQESKDSRDFAQVKKAAEKGSADAQLELAHRYASGEGVKEDPKQAFKWRTKAAEQGLAQAQYELGWDYANGSGVKEDPEKAMDWMLKAADKGLPRAQYVSGLWLAKGHGIKANAVKAAQMYRLAADHQVSEAIFELGMAYFEGAGVPKDVQEALRWIRKAAFQNFWPAQYRLGLCYLKGDGVAKDFLKAYVWFNLAAGHAEESAYDIRVSMVRAEQSLTPGEILRGQQLSREFKPGEVPSWEEQATPPAAADPALVEISGPDAGSEVYVDGVLAGRSPVKLALPEGKHIIEVRKP